MPSLPTRDTTRRLTDVARHVVVPAGIVATGWPAVEQRCRQWGDEFDAWQAGIGRMALGKRRDGRYAATVGGVTLSIPRQVAKTFLVGRVVFALCTLFPDLRVLWTAHHGVTLKNTLRNLAGLARRPRAAKYIHHIHIGNNDPQIGFNNGSRIQFGAREMGYGRGLDAIDIEVFDEAQILTLKALEDMVAATNQARHPSGALLFYMGTPPRPNDPGEVFTERRREALSAKPAGQVFAEHGDAMYVECSADEDIGRPGGPSLDDPKQWRQANPSYPRRTPHESMLRLRKNLRSDEAWRREGLGVWDSPEAARRIISDEVWCSRKAGEVPSEGLRAYGVKFAADGTTVALAAALKPADGPVLVWVVEHRSMASGIAGLVKWLTARWRDAVGIAIDGKSHAGALAEALVAAGVPEPRRKAGRPDVLVLPTVGEVITANSSFVESLLVGDVLHTGQPGLDRTVRGASRRPIGTSGGWGFAPIEDDGDVTPLDAVALARWMVVTGKRRPGRKTTGGVMT